MSEKVLHEEPKQYDDPQKKRLREYIDFMLKTEGSDLHIKPKSKPKLRINGDIELIEESEEYTKEDTLALAKEMLRSEFQTLLDKKDIDFTYTLEDDEAYRFRVNIFFQKDGASLVLRVIPTRIYTLDELDLPQGLRTIPTKQRGLVLVTGVTGSGKSTTLSALINEINMNQKKHILTIEDPIEFIHKDKKSIINQRSVGQDATTFHHALRAALREDPDIILVGEIRDVETVEMALHAAETGHLVFATLHTANASESIKRIIGMFPSAEQPRIRFVLGKTIEAIVSQRLVKNKAGGRLPAIELLLSTPRISQLIIEGRDDEIETTLDAFKTQYNTHSFDEHLYQLFKADIITEESALTNASRPDNLKLKLQGVGISDEDDESGESTHYESTGIKLKFNR